MTALARVVLAVGLIAATIWSLVSFATMWVLAKENRGNLGGIAALIAGVALLVLSVWTFVKARRAVFTAFDELRDVDQNT